MVNKNYLNSSEFFFIFTWTIQLKFSQKSVSSQFLTGFIRLKSEYDPIDVWCFYLKSSKWTKPNAMHTCDRNGSPNEIMTAINSAKSHVHGLLFYFAIVYIRRKWKRRRRSKSNTYWALATVHIFLSLPLHLIAVLFTHSVSVPNFGIYYAHPIKNATTLQAIHN